MSPRSLTEDVDVTGDAASPARVDEVPDTAPGRARLTVREMQIALEAARSLAGAPRRAHRAEGPTTAQGRNEQQSAGNGRVGEGGADRGRAAPCRDAVAGVSPVTPPTATPDGRAEPWLPTHDGPVSLTGVAAPRTRTVRRTAATLDQAARRPGRQRTQPPAKTTITLDAALAAAAVAAPPRIVLVGACGGAGATTAAVLLGAALAPVVATMLVAGGADRGALAVRADAHGGDVARLAAWAGRGRDQPLVPDCAATGDAGTGTLTLAAAGRDDPEAEFDTTAACDLFAAAAAGGLAVLLDWSSPAPPPGRAWAAATHVLVTAPATSPGLLAAEYAVQSLAAGVPAATPLSVLIVDVRGRRPRRAGRAALARLRALRLPVTSIPYDPALADEPRVRWPALRPRTRAAVAAALSQLLPGHQREDSR